MALLDVVGNVLLFALVFGMSATVDTSSMQHQVRNKKAILLGLFCQFIVLPLLGFLVVYTLKLDAALGITLLVVTSSPGGSYSNWWCSLFNADLALSVTMTAISSVLSIFLLPVNLLLYTNLAYEEDVTEKLDWASLFIALVVVISAIGLGLYCSYRSTSPRYNIIANQIGNIAGLCLIVFSATVTNMGDADSKIWSRDWTFYVAVATPCFIGLVLASFLATLFDLEPPERISVAIECSYQNIGIGTSLALTMFEGNDLNDAMGVPFFYGVCEAVMVGVFCAVCWKAGWSKAPSDAPLWKVLSVSYEVVSAHGEDLDGAEVTHDERGESNTEGVYVEMEKVDESQI